MVFRAYNILLELFYEQEKTTGETAAPQEIGEGRTALLPTTRIRNKGD